MSFVTDNHKAIREKIDALQRTSLLPGPTVKLIAVSKGQTPEAIVSLLEEGQRDFGENRVQEAEGKWGDLKRSYPEIRLHLIGPLQTNKVKDALFLFNVIHTVDRKSLVDALVKARQAEGIPRDTEFFIQVNTGEEPQKAGISPSALPELLHYCKACSLPVSGLMCIPPANEPPAPHFALLQKYARQFGLDFLSMGMSADYEAAIRLGATHVRIGTALFGERLPSGSSQ